MTFAGRFLEYQIVAVGIQRIAREFERNVIVAAKRKIGEGVKLPLGQFGREFDRAGCHHIG